MVWNADTGAVVRQLRGHGHWVNTLALSSEYVGSNRAVRSQGGKAQGDDETAKAKALSGTRRRLGARGSGSSAGRTTSPCSCGPPTSGAAAAANDGARSAHKPRPVLPGRAVGGVREFRQGREALGRTQRHVRRHHAGHVGPVYQIAFGHGSPDGGCCSMTHAEGGSVRIQEAGVGPAGARGRGVRGGLVAHGDKGGERGERTRYSLWRYFRQSSNLALDLSISHTTHACNSRWREWCLLFDFRGCRQTRPSLAGRVRAKNSEPCSREPSISRHIRRRERGFERAHEGLRHMKGDGYERGSMEETEDGVHVVVERGLEHPGREPTGPVDRRVPKEEEDLGTGAIGFVPGAGGPTDCAATPRARRYTRRVTTTTCPLRSPSTTASRR